MGMAGGFLLVGAAVVGIILLGGKAASAVGGNTTAGAANAAPGPNTAGMASDRDYLQTQGLSKIAAAGVVGNLWQESSGDPRAPGGGLAQWIGARWQALTAFARQHGLDPNSNAAQLQYLVTELRAQYPGLIGQLNSAGTPAEAATLFSNVYERPGNPQLSNRQSFAQQAYGA